MNLENFPYSESGRRMMSYLTQNGFYDNSYVGKWIFEVMGQEWDKVMEIFDTFPLQGFPETCTWSLKYFEQQFGLYAVGTFEERKQALLKKITNIAPFNPEKIRLCIEELSGIDLDRIQIVEYPEKFLIEIKIMTFDDDKPECNSAKEYLNDIKPAHLLMLFVLYLNNAISVSVNIESKLEITSNCDINQEVSAMTGIKTEIAAATDSASFLRVEKNLWLLDGKVLLDGSKILNAEIQEFEL